VNIARLGSAIADIASPSTTRHRQLILREAALFNLAVALYDTAFDDAPTLRSELADVLSVSRVRDRLEGFSVKALRSEHPRLGDLVSLVESVVSSIRWRYRATPRHLSYLGDLIDKMYSSEVTPHADRRDAKILPIVFIGALSDEGAEHSHLRLFVALGKWLSLMDDWQDMGRDMVALRANQFIIPRDGQPGLLLRYATQGLRLVLDANAPEATRNQLTDALRDLLLAADLAGDEKAGKTRGFATTILGLDAA
jgi:hypothetical protein